MTISEYRDHPTLHDVVAALPGAEPQEHSIRAIALPDRYRRKLGEAEDCGFAVNRSGWWNRTPKGEKFLIEPAGTS